MTQEVINKGAKGVVYWEPAWLSSPCWTQWGQGSHQEHATYFDFQNSLLTGGGVDFMSHNYENLVSAKGPASLTSIKVWPDSGQRNLTIQLRGFSLDKTLKVNLLNSKSDVVASQEFGDLESSELVFAIPALPMGLYYCSIYEGKVLKAVRGVALGR